jgi:gas vesicle protein
MSAADKATEVVADTADRVSKEAADFAEFTRQLNKTKLQYALLGTAIGATIGSLTAFYVANRKAETKYSKIADAEIAEMREHYQAKTRAAEATTQKPDLDSIVVEKGYSSPNSPPMAVQPPETVVEDETNAETSDDSEADEPEVLNVFKEAEFEDTWEHHEELKQRSPDTPYVIHYDERHEMDYQSVTLTYYDGDDVLCNEEDEIIGLDERDAMVGDRNLFLFGHGSNDPAIVYVRNDRLELVFEIVQSDNSFAEEVHGFQHDAYDSGPLERMRARERNDPEE